MYVCIYIYIYTHIYIDIYIYIYIYIYRSGRIAGKVKTAPRPAAPRSDRRRTGCRCLSLANAIIIIISSITISIVMSIIMSIIITISSSSIQRSARGTVDEMHVFQKKVLSTRPETTVQVYFNANTHLSKLRCYKNKNSVLAKARCTFSSLLQCNKNTFWICSESHVVSNDVIACTCTSNNISREKLRGH